MSATRVLVAAYGFEEGSGTTVVDVSGSGNDGSIVNATRTSDGVYGSALSFDGSSARVIVPDSASLHLANDMTLEAWVKPSTVSNVWRDVIYKGDDNYFLEAASPTGPPAAGGIFDGEPGAVYGQAALPTATWTHLALTYNGSKLRLFVDGEKVAAVSERGTVASSSAPLEIGGDGMYGRYFQGPVDEVRVYNVARSQAEIRSDMATPLPLPPPDLEPPSKPGSLLATAAASDRVELSWDPASDDRGVVRYELERCGGEGCTDFAHLTDTPDTAYSDASAAPSTSYTYRVRAADAAGNLGPFSDTATATTPAPPDLEPPSKPGSLLATAAASDRVELSWDPASDDRGVVRYELERCGGEGCTDFAHLTDTPDTAYSDASAAPSTSYTYRVRAADAAGNLGPFSDTATATTPAPPDLEPPSKPGSLLATAAASDRVELSWDPASDDRGVVRYELERCGGEGCTDFAHLTDTPDTAYSDASAAPSTSYTYRVRAADAAGNLGPFSDTATATTPAPPDLEPPSKPGSLLATAAASDRVELSWDPASDDRGVVRYELERCGGEGCTDFAHLTDTPDTAYSDASAAPSTSYTYRVRAADAAGNLGPFSDTATATTPAAPPVGPGPVRVGPTGRYLVDQNGVPFLISGESPQALIGDVTESDAALFFENRRAHGFNTVWINLLCNGYTGCRADGSTWDGIPPFTTPGDFSTPNDAYFAHVDRILRLAANYGFVVILDPAETGGWLTTMVNNGVDKLRAYGQYLGGRYKDFPNIIWMHGNDYQDWGPANDPYVTAVALGIRDVDTSHLQTVELNYLVSGSLDDSAWAPLIDLNASYTYFPTYEQVLKDYDRSNFLPTFLVEASYEFEQNPGTPAGTPQQLRRQEYWSLLSGATGQLFGNHYTWQFICPQRDDAGNCVGGWKDQLDTPGAIQIAYLDALFDSRKWYELVPDQAHTVVTDGFGTFGSDDYVTAARTQDGTLAMAYVPSSRSITVDLSTLSGPVTARWYDPTAGTFTGIPGSPFANVGSMQFATPGRNAGGDDDWVLVLEAP